MSFEEHISLRESESRRRTAASASLLKMGAAPAKLHITFTAQMLIKLGWRYDDRFEAMIGKGEDHGRVRLYPKEGGQFRLRRRVAGKSDCDYGLISLGVVSQFVNDKRPLEHCRVVRLPNRVVEIALPAWAMDSKVGPKPVPLRVAS